MNVTELSDAELVRDIATRIESSPKSAEDILEEYFTLIEADEDNETRPKHIGEVVEGTDSEEFEELLKEYHSRNIEYEKATSILDEIISE